MDLQHTRRISRLVYDYLQGRLNESEQKELDEWRKASEGHEEIFLRMQSAAYLEESFRRFTKNERETEREWQSICRRTVRKKRKLYPRLCRYAAFWFLPFLLAGGIYFAVRTEKTKDTAPCTLGFQPGQSSAILQLANGTEINLKEDKLFSTFKDQDWEISQDSLKYRMTVPTQDPDWHILRVPRGGEYVLILSDGTKVFLNAESRMKYPVHFAGDTRRVILEGEAYFEVSRDALHPFIVETKQLSVNVLGTSFGVRAYPEETKVLTTLVTGMVNVNAEGKQLVLRPEEQAVFDKSSNSLTRGIVAIEQFVGWKDGRLVFDNCPLEDILTNLGRWYSFDTFYTNPATKEIPFSLNIRKHEKFSEVLELMQKTGKIHFDINKNTVIVK